MTAYRRKDRKTSGYLISPVLPKPWGRVGPWQTGLHQKRQAEAVETWIQEIARTRPELVDMIESGQVRVMDAWVAKLRGTLEALIAGVNDPLLSEAVEKYRPHCKDERARSGLDQLLEYTEGKRLSWLSGNNVSEVYGKALETRRPNSVRRSLYRAVSELLTYHLGLEGRERALKGVHVPGEEDTRVVQRTGEEVTKVLEACKPESFRWMCLAAIATAVDRKPLLAMTPRMIHEDEGTIEVPDTKTKDRKRILRVSDIAFMAFRLAAKGKGLDERLWPWTGNAVRHYWDDATQRAEVPGFRFKDLRHLLPTLLAEMGMDRRSIQAYLGHATGSKQTDRYITPTGDVGILNAACEKLGLTKQIVRAG